MLRAIAIMLVSLLMGACAGAEGTLAPPTVTSARPAEKTQAPPAATTVTQPSPSPAGEVWDLLWVSDSTGSGGVPQAYAKRIEAAAGVTVRVRDGWTGNLQASSVLNTLRGTNGGMLSSMGSGDFNLPDAVRDAEVIVISGGPGELPTRAPCPPRLDPAASCGTAPSCGPEVWAPLEADLGAIFDEVFKLREGRPVILRTHDWYLPWGPHDAWEACNIVEPCVECNQRQFSAAIHRAASSYGVPVADYMAAFNGPNQDEALPSPWIKDDGVHPTAEGAEHLADVVAALGFEPVTPPE